MADWTQWIARNRWRIAFIAILFVLFSFPVRSILSWGARVQHNQAGEVMHALMLSVQQYSEDHNGMLPPTKTWNTFKDALWPYTKSEALFYAYPDHTHLFLPNRHLSQKKLLAVKRLTVLLYESAPSTADNSRWVSFLPEATVSSQFRGDPDFAGLRLVKEGDWQRLKAANGIP